MDVERRSNLLHFWSKSEINMAKAMKTGVNQCLFRINKGFFLKKKADFFEYCSMMILCATMVKDIIFHFKKNLSVIIAYGLGNC